MDEDYAQPRDVNSDLAEITSRLGEPDSTYRTNPASVAWRFVLGVLIAVAAVGLNYFVWTGQIPWPGNVHLFVALLAGMFGAPGLGIYLIVFAMRGRKLWVLTYPTGLFVWHRGRVIAFPWDDVKAIRIAGLPEKAILHRPDDADDRSGTTWFDLTRSSRRILGTTITITRPDGEQAALSSTLADFAALGQRVQEETYRRLFPAMWESLGPGRAISFGPVTCSLDWIAFGKDFLPWSQVAAVVRASDKLEVKRIRQKKKAWRKCNMNDVVNPHVLMGVVAKFV